MPTENAKVEFDGKNLSVVLPMTQPTGKVRIKERSFFSEYGNPVAARQSPLTSKCYVEWQIGYDVEAKPENRDKTSLNDRTFRNYKNITKYAYELSEIVYYSYKLGLLDDNEIKKAAKYINSIPDDNLIDTIDSMRITRTYPVEVKINDMDFYEMKVAYPLIVHRFGKYEIFSEVMNREKQRGVGVQPMLYVCIPITELFFDAPPLQRILVSRECSKWKIGKNEAKLSLELFKIFGMLSPKHRFDVLAILNMLFDTGILSETPADVDFFAEL